MARDPRLDALLFTGGIGEYAGRVRASIVERLAVLGVGPVECEETGDDRVLHARGAVDASRDGGPEVLWIEAREDPVVARAVTTLTAPS